MHSKRSALRLGLAAAVLTAGLGLLPAATAGAEKPKTTPTTTPTTQMYYHYEVKNVLVSSY